MTPQNTDVQFEVPSEEDARLIYQWRTDPKTLRHWFNPQKFDLDTHLRWYAKVVSDPTDHLLLGLYRGSKVGVLRLTTANYHGKLFGEVGIYVDPKLQGKHLGWKLLSCFPEWCRTHVDSICFLVAKVDGANVASQKIFEKVGFEKLPWKIWGGLGAAELTRRIGAHVFKEPVPGDVSQKYSLNYVAYVLRL